MDRCVSQLSRPLNLEYLKSLVQTKNKYFRSIFMQYLFVARQYVEKHQIFQSMHTHIPAHEKKSYDGCKTFGGGATICNTSHDSDHMHLLVQHFFFCFNGVFLLFIWQKNFNLIMASRFCQHHVTMVTEP
jgi:hypothetical protein